MPTLKTARRLNREYAVNLNTRRNWYSPDGEPPAPPTPPVVPPVATPTPEAKFTQEELNNLIGNRVKEAKAAERKALLKELGYENVDDPEAVKTVKGKLTAAQQAEDAKKSAETLALEKITQLEKERDEAMAASQKALAQRRTDQLNGYLKELARDAKAQIPSDVVDYLNKNHAAEVEKLMGEDGKFDEKAAAPLLETVKKVRQHWFGITGMGTMSLREGRTVDVSQQEKARGTASTNRAIRKGF